MRQYMNNKCSICFLLLLFIALPAWAGNGWYLITPPGMKGENKDQPLSKWDQMAAFEKVKDCETAKINGYDKSFQDLQEALIPEHVPITPEQDKSISLKRNTFMAFATSRCISSDDPRLK